MDEFEKAPFNEEDVVDNRITLTLYDESRNELQSRSRKIGRKAPKKPSEPEQERSLRRSNRRMARKSFFHNMFGF